jgi:hypothetical protein
MEKTEELLRVLKHDFGGCSEACEASDKNYFGWANV